MSKKKLLAEICLAAATMTVPVAQAAEHEAKWGISGWINESILYYDDGEDTGAAQISDNGTTLGSRVNLSGSFKPAETDLTAGFEVILEVCTRHVPLVGVIARIAGDHAQVRRRIVNVGDADAGEVFAGFVRAHLGLAGTAVSLEA